MADTFIKQLELLAPAKDLVCGMAAISCGADAVYVGAAKFGARSAAGNTVNDIEKLCVFSHTYKAKVYVTINTILFDGELDEAEQLIHQVYEAGADGIIIQDMGILEMNLPPISLIASTQTDNSSWQKIRFLEDVGFQRVILARELTLNQIKEIRSKTNIQLESFVHGSLCVSYSGQCYLSHALGGRSGNRGECAQPCRMKYDLVNEEDTIILKGKHLLSLKDLNLSEYLKELVDAGITSFKIEGRLKDIVYVKNTVAYYRQKIDEILLNTDTHKASSGHSELHFIPNLIKTFNRGYSTYFLHDRGEDITSFDSPKSRGEFLGKISYIKRDSFIIKTEKKICNGDGVCFFSTHNKELFGTNINRVDGATIFPGSMENLEPGLDVYRNFDITFDSTVRNDKTVRKINVEIIFKTSEKGFILQSIDEDKTYVQLIVECEKQIAVNQDKAYQTIHSQLLKSGGTIFHVSAVNLQSEDIFFIPISILNNARRELLELLENKRLQTYIRTNTPHILNEASFPDKNLSYLNNIANQKAIEFYKRHGANVLEMAYELSGINNSVVMRMKHCIKFAIGECPKFNGKKTDVLGKQLFLKDGKNKMKLEFDCKSCVVKIYY